MPSRKSEAAKAAASPSKRPADNEEDGAGADAGAAVKRRKGLGVRVIGRRIYDSENGKTCHQCRQKTIDVVASCKDSSCSKPCNLHFCNKCLLNRYGESVIEVSRLPVWTCPKCRGECNCSICLKKQGRLPTGILAHMAKATGFTSVADLLKKCPDARVDHEAPPTSVEECQGGESVAALLSTVGPKPVKPKAKKRKLVVTADGHLEGPVANALLRASSSSQKKARLNTVTNETLPPKKQKKTAKLDLSTANATGKKGKKKIVSEETLEKLFLSKSKESATTVGLSDLNKSDMKVEQLLPSKSKHKSLEKKRVTDRKAKRPLAAKTVKCESNGLNQDVNDIAEEACKPGKKSSPAKEVKKKKIPNDKASKTSRGFLKTQKTETKESKKKANAEKPKRAVRKETALPQGGPLTMVAGMDFPAEAIGHAIQFIEFCRAFQSVLGLKKGDAEAMLREFTKGRIARKGANSLLVQLHAKLLNIIESSFSNSSGEVVHSSSGQRSWLTALKHHLNERSYICKKLLRDDGTLDPESFTKSCPMFSTVLLEDDLRTLKDAMEKGVESYENLGLYHKLQLLVILCDDSLEAQSMREHMESVNREYNESQKGTREEVLAARKEAKDARQKIKDAEVAKLIAQGSISGPLTHEDQEALINKVQKETERAIQATSFEREAISRMRKGRSDAVRTDAITWTLDHRVFYKLKGVENADRVVVQECKAEHEQSGLDAWKVYTDVDEAILTKYLLQRAKLSRKKMLAQAQKESQAGGDAEKENRTPNLVLEENNISDHTTL